MRNWQANSFRATIDSGATTQPGAAYAEMIASASKPISIRSISVTSRTNVGGSIALSRAFAVGTATSAGVATGIGYRTPMGAPAPTAQLRSAWSSAPTGFVSRIVADILPLGTGAQRDLWREEDGPLLLEPGASLLLVNQASGIDGGGLRVNVSWEEGLA